MSIAEIPNGTNIQHEALRHDALLKQLKKLISDCKQQDPVNGSLQMHTGIIPPGVPGAGNYYVFILYVFSPNISTYYCGYIEFPPDIGPTYTYIRPRGKVCSNYYIPECFDGSREAAYQLRLWYGPNRPWECKKPGDVCDLTSAIAAGNDYLARFKIYGVTPANDWRDCQL